jgi:hypothetical protein
MLNVKNVATPLTAFAVVVPERVPPPGLVPIAIVIAFVAVVTRFPDASWTATCTAGAIEAPDTTFEGCTVNASFAGGPTVVVTLNGLLVALVNKVAPAVSV